MKGFYVSFAGALLGCVSVFAASVSAVAAEGKRASVLFPAELVANARANAGRYAWASEVRDRIVRSARPWMELGEDELWDLMFGSTLERSWMVWSSGHCPACRKGVPMYNWQIDAFRRPWKVRCPHCREVFPKNDFQKFYRSGLDEHGVFEPARADRSLLFNVEHPDPNDPLHGFGVDDGNGFVDGDKRWRFIGTYLIYGQWKQAVVGGIRALADAYVVTGDPAHARRAGILLDRVADLYPTFDFGKQGIVYERRGDRGYVSTWHDACEEVRQIALAYDQVFEALRGDNALVEFLNRKARQYRMDNSKTTFADIQRNIEERILRDTIRNRRKIESNYPRTDVALAIIKAVLDWPNNRDEVNALLDGIITKATAIDGVTGEKGLAGYATIGPRSLATVLGRFARLEPAFLREVYKRHPRLHQTYRFHVDTWCLGQYYPLSGDTGHFAGKIERYAGAGFARPGSLDPSGFTFMWNLYELTGDPAFVQVLYRANDNRVEGLPYDILATEPAALQKAVAGVIEREGTTPTVGSVNKQEWHLAILRSGKGKDARAVWLDYDAGGRHSHNDGMNLGLFAKGLDLMPDFGYPPVQYGGWRGEKFDWYIMPASHNTAVVDGKRQPGAAGKTTLWADGERFRAVRASAPALIGGQQFERTVAMVDISEHDFYVMDVLRIVGGKDHAKFVHSHFGKITPKGLSLETAEPYGYGTQMRNFQYDPAPRPGWNVDWTIDDRYKYLPPGSQVHLRYTDLTTDAQAYTAEGWVVAGIFDSVAETWIPRVMVRRRTETAPLASTFVSLIEPYERISNIAGIRRLALTTAAGKPCEDRHVAVEVRLTDGRRDVLVSADVESLRESTLPTAPRTVLLQNDRTMHIDGELCMIRLDEKGRVRRVALCCGRSVTFGNLTLARRGDTAFVEVRFDEEGRPTVVYGKPDDVEISRK